MTQEQSTLILYAIVLRIQSGSDCRHGCIEELNWETSLTKHEYIVGLEDDMFSITLRPSAKLLGKKTGPVIFYISDALTNYFFQQWHSMHAPTMGAQTEIKNFLFPKIESNGSFNWQRPFSYQNHKAACLACAHMNSIPVTAELEKTLGANAPRRGNAATVGMQIRGDANFNAQCFFISGFPNIHDLPKGSQTLLFRKEFTNIQCFLRDSQTDIPDPGIPKHTLFAKGFSNIHCFPRDSQTRMVSARLPKQTLFL